MKSNMGRLAAVLTAGIACVALAASLQAQPAGGGGGRGGPGAGGPPGMEGPMRGMGMRPNDQLGPFIATLADLNLRPDFNLTGQQETAIQAIRDAFKSKTDAWRQENAEKLREIDDQMAELREMGRDVDPETVREVMDARRELMETAPDGAAEVEQVKALLTADEKTALEKRQADMQRERPGGPQNGPRGVPGRPQSGPGGGPNGNENARGGAPAGDRPAPPAN